jgi:archaellum component FlaC
MSTREHYLNETKRKLDKWNKEIDNMEENAKNVGADMKEVHHKNIVTLKKNRDAAAKQIEELKNTTDSAWGDVKEGFEKAWDSISHSISTAKAKLFDKENS